MEWFKGEMRDRKLKWIMLSAYLLAVLVSFVAGLAPPLWGFVVLALALTGFGFWIGEKRIENADRRNLPRFLSAPECDDWTKAMSQFGGIRVRLYADAGDLESKAFAGLVIQVLERAGLIVDRQLIAFSGTFPDIAVFIDKSHENDRIGQAGVSFINLLVTKRLKHKAASIPDPDLKFPKQVEPGMIHIHIGPRYFTLLPG
jgi:hypothetical protein